jgi:aminoglycoside phosphotransferase (APT) family kinase protein
VPAVVEYTRGGQGAALLLQYLDGRTLQDVALNADWPLLKQAATRLTAILGRVWSATKHATPVNGRFLKQLQDRIDDVYRLHPELKAREVQIGTLRVASFQERLREVADIDENLAAPFSVFIHGDCNLDNIIYNPERDSVHLVDVQRSRDMDYVQDVSVFVVSAFRLPVMALPTRSRLERLTRQFLQFARDFARQNDDRSFEARLALGLVRSFATSTRFELNRRFARDMHQRAVLLLTKLAQHRLENPEDWSDFRVPDSVVTY